MTEGKSHINYFISSKINDLSLGLSISLYSSLLINSVIISLYFESFAIVLKNDGFIIVLFPADK